MDLSPLEQICYQIYHSGATEKTNKGPILKKHLLYSKNKKTDLFPEKTTLTFQSQFNSDIKTQVNNSSQSNYSYKKSKCYLSREGYEVIEAYNKKTKQKKLAKILSKSYISQHSYTKYLKREIVLHRVLKDSSCILKLEDVFESKHHIYLIYEFGTLLKGNEETFRFDVNMGKMKQMSLDVLIGLCEISTLKCCLAKLDDEMIIHVKGEGFKLFNFEHIFYFGEYLFSKMGLTLESLKTEKPGFRTDDKTTDDLEDTDEEESFYKVSWLNYLEKAAPEIDSIYFGLFLGAHYKRHTQTLQSAETFDDEYYDKLKKDSALSPIEKDLFSGLIQEKKDRVIEVSKIPLHCFYNKEITTDWNFTNKLSKTYRDEKLKLAPSNILRVMRNVRVNFERDRLSRTKGIFKGLKRREKLKSASKNEMGFKGRASRKQKKSLIDSGSFSYKSVKLAMIPKNSRKTLKKTRTNKSSKTSLGSHAGHSMNPVRQMRSLKSRMGLKNRKSISKRVRIVSTRKRKKSGGFFTGVFKAFEKMMCCQERDSLNVDDLSLFEKNKRDCSD